MDRSVFVQRCNTWAANGTPFLFVIDYDLKHFHMVKPGDAASQQIFYQVGERSNVSGAMGTVSDAKGTVPGSGGTVSGSGGTVSGSKDAVSGSGGTASGSEDAVSGSRGTASGSGGTQHRDRKNEPSSIDVNRIQQRKGNTFPGSGVDVERGQQHASRENSWSDAHKLPFRPPADFRFDLSPVPFSRYEKAFKLVRKNILHGNSFLLNLTFPTAIDTDLSLEEIFLHSQAPYKLYFKDQFVLFSPESFIQIRDGEIYSYPMKGTIDASVPHAEQKLMENEKELWEHNTIVDLIRNDLSMVARNVEVTKYRYIDRVRTHKNELLQVSSEIRGQLGGAWKGRLGEILLQLLPAGSISGAPKKKTREIIAAAEGEKRGYFTGIFGIFDGENVDSAVMIRFIERAGNGLQFRSGGGITGHSDVQQEYNEMIDKVYVPFI